MTDPLDFTRRVKRLPLTLPIRVFCRESSDYEWTEQSRLIDVSQFGAGFTLTRPIDIGRLIKMTIPLPQKLRCFDHMEPMYSVWSLVRHASAISKVNGSNATLFRMPSTARVVSERASTESGYRISNAASGSSWLRMSRSHASCSA